MRQRATVGLSVLLVVAGLALIGRTIQAGIGGGLGLLFGGLLVVAGAGRLWVHRRIGPG